MSFSLLLLAILSGADGRDTPAAGPARDLAALSAWPLEEAVWDIGRVEATAEEVEEEDDHDDPGAAILFGSPARPRSQPRPGRAVERPITHLLLSYRGLATRSPPALP